MARKDKGGKHQHLKPEQIDSVIEDAVQALARGDTTEQIAARHSINKRTLNNYLKSDPRAEIIRDLIIVDGLQETYNEIDDAKDSLGLGKVREKMNFKKWEADRRAPKLYSPKQEVTHKLPHGPLISITLSPQPGATIEGQCQAVSDNGLISIGYATAPAEPVKRDMGWHPEGTG